jgi:hypothetical protein
MSKKRRVKNNSNIKRVDPNDPKYIAEQKYLNRWKGVKATPTFFEKIDKDAVYEGAIKNRQPIDPFGEPGEPTMGTTWGVGKPKGPN